MKKFEIQYVSRYYDEKNYCSEIISANSEDEALISFANIFEIENFKLFLQPFFIWENGEWLSSFKCINEVKEISCPQCNGAGKININI
ncbi:MAG: hypothetical protein U9R42_02170 [Bacteroidota bacterium]|nr:hypothetical protein [Bacteroidota bacterium]